MAASATDAYTVPADWVERNSRLFKTAPPAGFDHSHAKRPNAQLLAERDALLASLLRRRRGGSTVQDTDLDAAVGGSELSDDGMGNIDLPPGPQPVEYWRNVENHGNILVTFISTARRKTGFFPDISSDKFTREEAREYTRKFNAWMHELDSYSHYIHFAGSTQDTKSNKSTDCKVILKGISDFVVGVTGVTGDLAQSLTERVTSLVKSSADFVTHGGTAVQAGFTLETTETTGEKNPIQPISFASTFMSKTKSGKSTSEASEITLAAFTFKLNSDAIISAAEHLSKGSTLAGSKQYRDYVNAPLINY